MEAMHSGVTEGSVPVPGLYRYFDHGEQDADGGQKSLGPLPVLFMLFHTALQVGNPPAIAIAHQTRSSAF